jgi:GR25 family glycosyltransferase involved in LPS biosynthesis
MNIDIKKYHFVYLNLKERVDRRSHTEGLLSSFDLKYSRFEAIKPTKESVVNGDYKFIFDKLDKKKKTALLDNIKLPSNQDVLGEIGCHLSHYFALKANVNSSPFVIIEDDVRINDDFFENINEIINSTKLSFDIARTNDFSFLFRNKDISSFSDCLLEHGDKAVSFKKECYHHRNGGGYMCFGGTHFNIINSARNVLKLYDSTDFMPTDLILATNKIKSVVFNCPGAWQAQQVFGSDIKNEIK